MVGDLIGDGRPLGVDAHGGCHSIVGRHLLRAGAVQIPAQKFIALLNRSRIHGNKHAALLLGRIGSEHLVSILEGDGDHG